MHDPLTRVMCCLLGAVNGSFLEEGLPTVDHTYMSHDLAMPHCVQHGFATIRWNGSYKQEQTNDRGCKFSFRVEEFTLRVGRCAPPSISLLKMVEAECDLGSLYGECAPCSTDLTDYTPPPSGKGCMLPDGYNRDTGEVQWPIPATPMSYSDHARYLNMTGQALRRHLKNKACNCLAECYKGDCKQFKNNMNLGDITSWCEGRFAGIDIPVTARVENG